MLLILSNLQGCKIQQFGTEAKEEVTTLHNLLACEDKDSCRIKDSSLKNVVLKDF